MSQLDRILGDADPARAARGPRIEAFVTQAAAEASAAHGRHQLPPRKRLFLPLIFGGALALTGAAATVVAPLWFYQDGEPSRGDVIISVEYQTKDGMDTKCTYEVQFGAQTADGPYPLPDNFDALIEDLNAPGRWDGFGDQVQAWMDTDSGGYEIMGGEPSPSEEWMMAAGAVLRLKLPPELSGLPRGAASDCLGIR